LKLILGVEPLNIVGYINNMPSRYVVRNLRENSYYHVYNRGVDNRNIFQDREDYETFLYYLYIYTASPGTVQQKYPKLPPRLTAKNLFGETYLIAYCLLPNHFHLLLKQKSSGAMPRLLKQVINGYVTYFNKKYKKSGAIFQGRYKSMRIESEYLLVQMVRFVHLNPSIAGLTKNLNEYYWSSYVNKELTQGIINRFKNVEEWEKFHLDSVSYESNFNKIKNLTID
jgi:putative transposase